MIQYNSPNLNNINLDSEISDIESDEEINTTKLNKFRKQFNINSKIIPDNYDSDNYDSDSTYETDEELYNFEITIKGQNYIVEKSNIYTKNNDGTKGILYGKYVNDKIMIYKLVEFNL